MRPAPAPAGMPVGCDTGLVRVGLIRPGRQCRQTRGAVVGRSSLVGCMRRRIAHGHAHREFGRR